MVKQPDEAAAQAEVDGPAVRDDTVVTLQPQHQDHKWTDFKQTGSNV